MGIAYGNYSGLSVAVLVGRLGDEDIEYLFRQFAADPDWARGGRILTDATQLDERMSDERIVRGAETFRAHLAGRAAAAKWAIVADRSFEEATKFSENVQDEAPRLIVFAELAAACAWLGDDLAVVLPTVERLRAEAARAN
jgi:hypothetical protein